MIATWMAYAILVGGLATAAAYSLDRAARAVRLPRRFIWLSAMVATVAAPFVGYAIRLAAPADAVSEGVSLGPITGSPVASDVAAPSALSNLITGALAAAAKLNRPVAIIWAILTLILMSRILYATAMLWRRQREWVAREIDGIPLYVTPDLGPAVVALPESRILVPQWLLALDATQISTVLRHEREHHAAGDARLLVAASVFSALFPWNLALWWQTRRLRLAVEMDCDARVLRQDPRVDHYGALLLAIAQHPRATLHAAATLTESTSDLERRIDAMTSTPPSAPRLVAAVCSACAVGAIFVACAMPAPDVVSGPTKPQTAMAEPRPLSEKDVLFEFQVEESARPLSTNTSPVYPAQLRAAGLGGVVVARFVVDTNGAPERETLLIVKSDHDLFAASVAAALPNMRFAPAQVGGHPVKQLTQMPFVFALSAAERTLLLDSMQMRRPVSDAAEVPAPQVNRVSGQVIYPKITAVPYVPRSAPSRPYAIERLQDTIARLNDVPSLRAPVKADTVEAQALPTNLAPRYPVELRVANIEGKVVAKFVVRSDGTVDIDTFEVITSSHELFANAVKAGARDLKFKPATVNGKPIDKAVQMTFAFSLAR